MLNLAHAFALARWGICQLYAYSQFSPRYQSIPKDMLGFKPRNR